MTHPLNEGMQRREEEQGNMTKPVTPEPTPITADVAVQVIGSFLEQQKQDGIWHRDMTSCLRYLHRLAKQQEQSNAPIE